MKKVLFILIIIFVINSCTDDMVSRPSISPKFPTSERIGRNLKSTGINGINKDVGIYSLKTEVDNPKKEHIFVQYYLENSAYRFYEFITPLDLLIKENSS